MIINDAKTAVLARLLNYILHLEFWPQLAFPVCVLNIAGVFVQTSHKFATKGPFTLDAMQIILLILNRRAGNAVSGNSIYLFCQPLGAKCYSSFKQCSIWQMSIEQGPDFRDRITDCFLECISKMSNLLLSTFYCIEECVGRASYLFHKELSVRNTMLCDLVWNVEISLYFFVSRVTALL